MLVENDALSTIRAWMDHPSTSCRQLVSKLIEQDLLVKTDDGTFTLRSSGGEELMHSRIGAMKEALEKFALPSGLSELPSPRILDLCSGLGYNSLAALICNRDISIHMVEFSSELIYLGSCLESPHEEKRYLDQAVDDFFQKRTNSRFHISCGDAREVLSKESNGPYDIVFHDGFSPANDPVLYTVDFLSLLHGQMSDRGLLLSYSSSIPFRSALIEAGFHVGEGPSVGRKRGITVAAIAPSDLRLIRRLPSDDEKLIALATVGTPYRDPEFRGDSTKINGAREAERCLLREKSICLPAKKIKQKKVDKYYDEIQQNAGNSRDAILAMNKFLLTNTEI